MHIVRADERTGSREDSDPRFRVDFHRLGPEGEAGWTATYDVTGSDVLQAMGWAQREAAAAHLPQTIALPKSGSVGSWPCDTLDLPVCAHRHAHPCYTLVPHQPVIFFE